MSRMKLSISNCEGKKSQADPISQLLRFLTVALAKSAELIAVGQSAKQSREKLKSAKISRVFVRRYYCINELVHNDRVYGSMSMMAEYIYIDMGIIRKLLCGSHTTCARYP